MRMKCVDGIWSEVRSFQVIEMSKGEIVKARFNGSNTIVSVKDLKNTWKYLKEEFMGNKIMKEAGVVLKSGGVFWPIFMEFVFPWFLDIAKVYCCIKICQAFLQERSGSAGGDGKTGIQAIVHYGKWFLIFELIPFAVELIDQIGHKMITELSHQKITIPTNSAYESGT